MLRGNNGDERQTAPYTKAMLGEAAHVRIKLNTSNPIAISDFVAEFVGIGNQFDKFIAAQHPDLKADTQFYVKEVRAGSIEADLVAWVMATATLGPGLVQQAVTVIGQAQILGKFVTDLKDRIGAYFHPKGRDASASKSDLADFHKTIAAVAHDQNGTALIEAAVFEDGERKIKSAFKFSTPQAIEAERQIEDHRAELEAKTDANHERVLMTFVRSSVQTAAVGKRSGELVTIPALHDKPLPIVYASDLAEQRIKHEIVDGDDNVYKRAFDVDVNVEQRLDGKPIAYRIVELHAVIDLPPDE
jgi:hypothetical protein